MLADNYISTGSKNRTWRKRQKDLFPCLFVTDDTLLTVLFRSAHRRWFSIIPDEVVSSWKNPVFVGIANYVNSSPIAFFSKPF
jgi:hypothetical protein